MMRPVQCLRQADLRSERGHERGHVSRCGFRCDLRNLPFPPLSSDGGEILFDVHKNGVSFVVASLKNKKTIAFFDFL